MHEKPGLLDRPTFIIASLVIVTATMLSRCWNTPFYHFDDYAHIYIATEDDWSTFRSKSHAHDPWHSLLFLEFLTTVSFRIDYAVFGTQRPPDPYFDEMKKRDFPSGVVEYPAPSDSWAPAVRIMNGVYHVIAGFILWLVLRRIGVAAGIAACAAVIWAGHPMACESICWISERKNVLAALFGFSTMLVWTGDRTWRWRAPLMWLLYAVALASKPTALGFLPLLIAFEIIDPVHRRFNWSNRHDWLVLARNMIIPVVLSVADAVFAVIGIAPDMVEPPGGSLFTALLTDCEVCARYVIHVVAPYDLSFLYGVEAIGTIAEPRLWIYGLGLTAFVAAILFAAGPQRRLALFGMIWFVVVIGPNWNLVAIPHPLQDRYAYMASPGLILAVATAIYGLLSRLNVPRFAPVCAAAAILPMLWLTNTRGALFSDEKVLILDAARRQPRSAVARRCASVVYKREYELHTQFGPEPNPELEQLYLNATIAQYKGALECPDVGYFFETFYLRACLADLLTRQGRTDEALSYLDGWLPPKNMKMLPEGTVAARRSQDVYLPQTLAMAWLVAADAHLRESFVPNLSNPQRVAKCQEALDAAAKSLAVHLFDYKAYVVKARTLIRLAELEKQASNIDAARKDLADAKALLREVPPESERGSVARYLLERIPSE